MENIKIYLKHGNVKDIFYQGCVHNGKVETSVDIGAIYEPMLIDAINGDLSVEYLTKHELIKKQIHTNQETIMERLQSFKKIIKIVDEKIRKERNEDAEKKRIDNIQLIKNLFKNGESISYNKNGLSFIISKENGWNMDVGERLFIKDNAIINIEDLI